MQNERANPKIDSLPLPYHTVARPSQPLLTGTQLAPPLHTPACGYYKDSLPQKGGGVKWLVLTS